MKRRLATLATLARLDDQRMRAAAAELAQVQERLAALAAEAQELERRRQVESTVTEIEAMPYLTRFLETLRRERDRIGADSAAATRVAEVKRGEVLDAWRDLRPKEKLQQTLRLRLRQERLLAEQQEADERVSLEHGRRFLGRQRALRD